MPLNLTQRRTLREILKNSIDEMLEKKLNQYLPLLIAPINLTLPQMIAILQFYPDLVNGLQASRNVPKEVRTDFGELTRQLGSASPNIPDDLLKRLKAYPNYDPFYIAAMQKFEDTVRGLDNAAKIILIRLRELYFEMTPLQSHRYTVDAPFFRFRIGQVPFNLDSFGPMPIPGEIQADVMDYIKERIELEEARQKELKMIEEKNKLQLGKTEKKYQEEIKKLKETSKTEPPTVSTRPILSTTPIPSTTPVGSGFSFFTSLRPIITSEAQKEGDKEKKATFIDEKFLFNLSVSKLKPLAAQGNPDAQALLGRAYLLGMGTSKNRKEAEKWLSLLVNRTDLPVGLFALGLCHEQGLGGIVQNVEQAVAGFKCAAISNYAPAQNYLGFYYFNGITMTQDKEKAVELYQLAAAQGYPPAQNNLGACYADGTGIAKDEQKAVRLYRRAFKQNYALSQYNLAQYYEHGRAGLVKNNRKAMRLYRLAADQGYAPAQDYLGACYEKGLGGVVENKWEAMRLYTLAANQGYPSARQALKHLKETVLAKSYGHENNASEEDRLMTYDQFKAHAKAQRVRVKAQLEEACKEDIRPLKARDQKRDRTPTNEKGHLSAQVKSSRPLIMHDQKRDRVPNTNNTLVHEIMTGRIPPPTRNANIIIIDKKSGHSRAPSTLSLHHQKTVPRPTSGMDLFGLTGLKPYPTATNVAKKKKSKSKSVLTQIFSL